MLKHFGSDSTFVFFGMLCLSKMTPGGPLGLHATRLEVHLLGMHQFHRGRRGDPLGSAMMRSLSQDMPDEEEDFSEVLQQAAPSKRSSRCWAFEVRIGVVGQMVLSLWHARVAGSPEVELTSQS